VFGSWQFRYEPTAPTDVLLTDTRPTFVKPDGHDAAGPVGGETGGETGGDTGGETGGDGRTKTPSPGEATPSEPEQAEAAEAARHASSAARTAEFFEVMQVSLEKNQGTAGERCSVL